MNVLKTENLSVKYGNKSVLKNLNIDFEKNKITAIIGPSGNLKNLMFSIL